MKKYMVMLDIETKSADPDRFQEVYGVKANLFKTRKIRRGYLWRSESRLDAKAPLSEHIKSVLKRIPLQQQAKRGQSLRGRPYFNVGLMYDSYTCTVDLPTGCLDLMSQHGVGIQVSCYPTEFKMKRK